jgi:DNA-binding beta-propeller fold protein YncE/rhodanese-related sulfurtransferase
MPQSPFKNRVRAPELSGGLGWLNSDHPLSLAELRGRIVLLDFWTYCCINCMHTLPDLKTLEERYPNELVVIGIHSAKFTNEGQNENIRQAILRYEINHPVVNDAQFAIWHQYGVRAWPTLVMIDPEGYAVGVYSGEGNLARIDRDIQLLLQTYPAVETQRPFPITREEAPAMPLRYPGKVLADGEHGRLFVADSNHNQIVVCTPDGTVRARIGSGAIGAADGDYRTAAFNHPQGMALVGETLYVADTENHLLRVVDLAAERVTTVAGTGAQAKFRATGGDALTTDINSPWDLAYVNGELYIAMAGPHQIWVYCPSARRVDLFAGSGAEARVDGTLDYAAFAQPSGIATDGAHLYVADSETSSIRKIDLETGRVTTLVGEDLFEFGDVDGSGAQVRLQHPLGVAYADGALLIADTYNHKIKRLDLATQSVTTLAGTGEHGAADGSPGQLYEPGGLSVAGNDLYIADTNNHLLRRLDRTTGALTTIPVHERAASTEADEFFPALETIPVPVQTVAAQTPITLAVAITLPPDHHINAEAPNGQSLRVDGRPVPLPAPSLDRNAFAVPLGSLAAGTHKARYTLTLYYCRTGNEAACAIRSLQWQLSLHASEGGGAVEIPLAATLAAQE